ncbi:MAG: hypothetical protein DRO13_03255 [Thermoprotei archaeon]|nr:MAG: hypothetical protein DRO13_03255 [Thermoprotei archaeon]
MTIYWERCSICGKYESTRQCVMFPDIMTCIHCCVACINRDRCPKPVWIVEVKHRKLVVPKRPVEDIKKKVMEELFSKLGADK